MGTSRIGVFGGINMDLVIHAERLPRAGETIKGDAFFQAPGGKGANQAVAAAKLGGKVSMFGHVGDDAFGKQLLAEMDHAGIDRRRVASVQGKSTGLAFIVVDAQGQNQITFVAGANDQSSDQYIDDLTEAVRACDLVLVQLECHMDMVSRFVQLAHAEHVAVVLNPAPALKLPFEIETRCSVIVPNETEAEILTGIRVSDQRSASRAASVLVERGFSNVIITMGAAGAFVLAADKHATMIPAPVVKAVDTVAAGDVFLGAFAVQFAGGSPIEDSILFANRAAALSTTRPGAQSSIPTLAEVVQFDNNPQEERK